MTTVPATPPTCLLLIGPGCPHCASVLSHLTELIKSAELARLEIVNVASDPQQARDLGVRSVPWLRIGERVFQGAQGMQELRDAIRQSNDADAMRRHLAAQISEGLLDEVQAFLLEQPRYLDDLVSLLSDEQTTTDVRIGIAALFEDIGETEAAQQAVPALKIASGDGNPRVRADACHLLGLIPGRESRDILRAHRYDPDATVREIAKEAL